MWILKVYKYNYIKIKNINLSNTSWRNYRVNCNLGENYFQLEMTNKRFFFRKTFSKTKKREKSWLVYGENTLIFHNSGNTESFQASFYKCKQHDYTHTKIQAYFLKGINLRWS